MSRKFKVGILGATGMVGQRFISLLEDHPQMEVAVVAASSSSAGRTYCEAVAGRLKPGMNISHRIMSMIVQDAHDAETICSEVDFVFSCVELGKEAIQELEETYAMKETVVVSNNSAHRWTEDVPMIIPEVNPDHLALLQMQKKRLHTLQGCVVVKPNCSLQSFLPPLHALMPYRILRKVGVTTLQAVSGAGHTLADWPVMADNVIPYISGEEEKTANEPSKILSSLGRNATDVRLKKNRYPQIRSTCIRVPVSDGHMAIVEVQCEKYPLAVERAIEAWRLHTPLPQRLGLHSAPTPCIIYRDEENRPQTGLDRDSGKGMAFTVGRYKILDQHTFRFVSLSHNTIRGAAGGAILTAELMIAQGYLQLK